MTQSSAPSLHYSSLEPQTQEDRRARISIVLCFFLSAFFASAGGLGLAATAALGAFITLRPKWLAKTIPSLSITFWIWAAAIVWCIITISWSPYTKLDQAWKLLILPALFTSFVACSWPKLTRPSPLLNTAVIFASIATLSFFAFEGLTHGVITESFERYEAHGQALDPHHLRNLTYRTLSRGATIALVLAGPAALILMRTTRHWALYIPVVILASVITAISFDNEANIVALVVALGLTALGYWKPRWTLAAFLAGFGIYLLISPIIMHAALKCFDPALREALPASWAWRLEIWQFTLDKIAQSPWLGQGLDAARTFHDVGQVQDFTAELMPLHAHNAALHIWMETGFIGALLFSLALLSSAYGVFKARLSAPFSAGLCWVVALWLVCIVLGYGVWQEWHHGTLAIGILACFSLRSART